MQLMLTFLFALIASLVLTPLVRALALRAGIVDRPGERSVHDEPVPILGGVALYVAFALAVWLFAGGGGENRGLLLGGAAILALGLADDWGKARGFRQPGWLFEREGRGLRPWVKLAGQAGAALILCAFGVQIVMVRLPIVGTEFFNSFAVPVTVLWVICLTNVINLIDGLDGLAAGICAIAALTLLGTAIDSGQGLLAVLLSAALLGSCVGFLPWNWAPARIFMGDAGSMFLGFALAAVSVEGALKSPAVVALAVPVLAVGLPVFDTLLAVIRRLRRGRPIGSADREHLHHRLLQIGLSPRDAVLLLYFVSGWLAVGALAVDRLDPWAGVTILGFVVVFLIVAARRLDTLHAGRRS